MYVNDTSHSIVEKFNQSSLASYYSAGTFSGSLKEELLSVRSSVEEVMSK